MISRFDKRQGMKFNPLSFEEMAYAPTMLRGQEDALNEQITAAADNLPAMQGDEADPVIEEWNKKLSEVSEKLVKSGYSQGITDEYNQLRRGYSQQIAPIKNFQAEKAEAIKKQAEYARDPNSVIMGTAPSEIGYGAWQKDKNALNNYKVGNTLQAQQQGQVVGKQMKDIYNDPQMRVSLVKNFPQFVQLTQSGKFSNPQEVIDYFETDEGSAFLKMHKSQLGYDVDESGRLGEAFKQGIVSTAYGADKINVIGNPAWLYEQKFKAAAASNASFSYPEQPGNYKAGEIRMNKSITSASKYNDLKEIIKTTDDPNLANTLKYYMKNIEDNLTADPNSEYSLHQATRPVIDEELQNSLTALGVTELPDIDRLADDAGFFQKAKDKLVGDRFSWKNIREVVPEESYDIMLKDTKEGQKIIDGLNDYYDDSKEWHSVNDELLDKGLAELKEPSTLPLFNINQELQGAIIKELGHYMNLNNSGELTVIQGSETGNSKDILAAEGDNLKRKSKSNQLLATINENGVKTTGLIKGNANVPLSFKLVDNVGNSAIVQTNKLSDGLLNKLAVDMSDESIYESQQEYKLNEALKSAPETGLPIGGMLGEGSKYSDAVIRKEGDKYNVYLPYKGGKGKVQYSKLDYKKFPEIEEFEAENEEIDDRVLMNVINTLLKYEGNGTYHDYFVMQMKAKYNSNKQNQEGVY